jgi:hypothetical protein
MFGYNTVIKTKLVLVQGIKEHGRMKKQLQSFLRSALERVKIRIHAPAVLLPGKVSQDTH